MALTGGVNPANIAPQMGHRSAKMHFSVYAKWIDGADQGRERAKLEAARRGTLGYGDGPTAANDAARARQA